MCGTYALADADALAKRERSTELVNFAHQTK
jgi:hypothetical protein